MFKKHFQLQYTVPPSSKKGATLQHNTPAKACLTQEAVKWVARGEYYHESQTLTHKPNILPQIRTLIPKPQVPIRTTGFDVNRPELRSIH